MKKIIGRLMARFLRWFGGDEPRIVFLKEAVWTDKEAKELKEFLKSELGERLVNALMVDCSFAQSWAISPNQVDMQFRAGFAHGKQRMVSRIHELALVEETREKEIRFEEKEIEDMLNSMATGKHRDFVYGKE